MNGKQQKGGHKLSFLTKKQKLELQLQRIEHRQQQLEASKQQKQADLMNAGNENEDANLFSYKISAKDYDLLQKAKQMEAAQNSRPPLGFMNNQPVQPFSL